MAADTSPDLTYSITEARKKLKISLTLAYQLIANGQLRTYLVSNRRYVSAQALAEFIQAREADSSRGTGSTQQRTGAKPTVNTVEVSELEISPSGKPALYFPSGKRVGRPPKARAQEMAQQS